MRARAAGAFGLLVGVLTLALIWVFSRGESGVRPSGPSRALPKVPVPAVAEGQIEATWGAHGPAESWLDFAPPEDDFSPDELGLRELNEPRAGDTGAVVAAGRALFRGVEQERFWGVNARERVLALTDAEMHVFATSLAKRGVNLVRLHLPYFDERDVRRVDRRKLERTHRLVAELASAGVSTALSIFFPYWLKPEPAGPIAGYDGKARAFGLLYADAGFRAIYRGWWRELLTGKNPYTGLTLAEDPAIALVEIINEDSTLFWSFESYERLPEAQTIEVERAFGAWLGARYGSVERALERWGGGRVRGDEPGAGRVGLLGLYTITHQTTARSRDTAEFLARTMRNVYTETRGYLRDELGVRALVVCSNWVTANERLLGGLERWANGVCDVMDRHGYFSGPHRGKDVAFRILEGQTYEDRSALLLEEEGGVGAFELPTSVVRYQDKPGIVSELNWPSPNRYRAELPLLALAYGSLHGASGYAFFTTEALGFAPTLTKFGIADPAILGQFPGAALAFRRRYVKEAGVVVRSEPKLAELFALRGGPLGGAGTRDALRAPEARASQGGARGSIDPLAPFVGQVEVSVSTTGGPTRVADLSTFVDRTAGVVRSTTGEVTLDLGRGLLTLNAPSAQGAAGFMGSASPIELSVVRIETGLEYGAVLAVSLDERPLASAQRILIQVASEVRNTAFTASGSGPQRIESVGRAPLQMRRIDGRVTLKRPDFQRLRAVALDPNGRPLRTATTLVHGLTLLPDALYYLLSTR